MLEALVSCLKFSRVFFLPDMATNNIQDGGGFIHLDPWNL